MRTNVCWIMVIAFAVLPCGAFAQTVPESAPTGYIQGRIVDERNVGVPYANVILRGTTIGGRCNRDGIYGIARVPVGSYVLMTKMMGYATEQSNIVVEPNTVTRVDFKLRQQKVRIHVTTVGPPYPRPLSLPTTPCMARRADTKSWTRVEWSGLSFLLPPTYREIKSKDIDPEVRRFRASDDGSDLLLDWGMYSIPLPDQGTHYGFRSCSERIGGALVHIVTASPRRGGSTRVTAAWRDVVPDLNLTISAGVKDQAHLESILTLVRTVQFDNQRRQLGASR